MEQLANRAEILLEQGRYKEAEEVLSELLHQNPNHPFVLSMCARAAIGLNQADKALELVETAIGIAPEIDYFFYLKANILVHLERFDDAENSLQEAINIDPSKAESHALWAAIKLVRKQYTTALEMANKALELDAENLQALNTRSTALLKLNRKEESYKTIADALQEDPNDADTHANVGWNLLEAGDHKKALEHFKESLSYDPNNRNAQVGMMNAIKAKYLVFRWFLKYAFWIQNLTAKYQWFVIIGVYVGFRMLRNLANNNEALQPFLNPLLMALTIIAFSTWIIKPVSNLFLRLNPYGKYLLNQQEKMSSNLVGFSAILFFTGLGMYAYSAADKWIALAAFGFAMMVPFSVMFSASKQKNALIIYAMTMFVVGIIALGNIFTTGSFDNVFVTIFLIGFIAFQWISNAIIIRESNH